MVPASSSRVVEHVRRDEVAAEMVERRRLADGAEVERINAELVSLFMPLARSLAARYRGRGENYDDLVQVAYLGLMKAVNGFDGSRGSAFASYAVPTISGELKRHFRDRCWAIRPTRNVQDLQPEISAAVSALCHQTGAEPTTADIAARLTVDEAAVIEARRAFGFFTLRSLDVPLGGPESTTLGSMIGDEDDGYRCAEARVELGRAMRGLTALERRVVGLRFYAGLTQQEIAEQVGTSQMQVSRLLSRAMRSLRAQIEGGEAKAAAS